MSYKPVSFKKFKQEALTNPKVLKSYKDLEEEFTLFAEMLKARKMAKKTQKDIAKKMHTSQAAIARIESSFGRKKYSPTLGTLRKYAKAIGCKLVINFVPKDNRRTA